MQPLAAASQIAGDRPNGTQWLVEPTLTTRNIFTLKSERLVWAGPGGQLQNLKNSRPSRTTTRDPVYRGRGS